MKEEIKKSTQTVILHGNEDIIDLYNPDDEAARADFEDGGPAGDVEDVEIKIIRK